MPLDEENRFNLVLRLLELLEGVVDGKYSLEINLKEKKRTSVSAHLSVKAAAMAKFAGPKPQPIMSKIWSTCDSVDITKLWEDWGNVRRRTERKRTEKRRWGKCSSCSCSSGM